LGPNALECPPAICGLRLPDDLWKRDALKKQPEAYLNAATVVIDRSRRQGLDQRFTETPLLETRLGDSSCLGSLMIAKDFQDKAIMKFLRCGF